MNKLERTLTIILLYRIILLSIVSYFVFCQNATGWLYLLILTSPTVNNETRDKLLKDERN